MSDALRMARTALAPLLILLLIGLLLTVGQLPELMPPRPPPMSDGEINAERARTTIAADALSTGTSEVPAIRLLDHLATAQRRHPDILTAYRALAVPRGGPGHWRHYVDPWSKLPAALRPLRVQMTFASHDVRGFAREAPKGHRRLRLPFGRDRKMNRTPGVNAMRLSLFAPTPSRFTFRVALPERAFLTLGTGVPLNGARGPVRFLVEIAEEGKQAAVVARYEVPRAERHRWKDRRVDLAPWAGKDVRLTLRAEGPRGAFAFWSNPVIWKSGAGHKGKNVLFILVDTLRADAVKSVAGTHPVTPHLDRLAAGGAVFTRCFSLSSWTRSSMLAMFTGEHVSRFHPKLNTAFWLPRRLRQQMYRQWPRLLTWHMRQAGYWVEAIGNNFFLPGYTPIGFDRGFDRVTDIRAHIQDTPAITRGALRFLDKHRKRPFFLYLHYDGPHAPYIVPKGYRVKGARPRGGPTDVHWEAYLGETRWTDEHLAPVFAALEKHGLAKNTLVVVTADHGEVFHRAHDVIYGDKNRTLHHHGWSVFQEVLHVPLILSLPGAVPAGRRIEAPVSHLDLVPTLLDLAGLPPMPGHKGRSLTPSLRYGRAPSRKQIAAIGRNVFSLREGRWTYIHRDYVTRVFRRPKTPDKRTYWKWDLYDLETDPDETRNVAREHPERARKMRETLLSLVLPGGAGGPSQADPFAAEGLRLSLRLWGGSGQHRVQGRLRCDGAVTVRSLRGPTSHAGYRGKGEVAVLLKNRAGQPAEVELEFVGCQPSSISLDLRLDGKPIRAHQIAVGPIGLTLMRSPSRLPLSRLPALVSRTPPPALASATPRIHLWLGSSWDGGLDLGGGKSEGARLADQMLRDAGYSKGPSAPRPRPRPRPAGGGQ